MCVCVCALCTLQDLQKLIVQQKAACDGMTDEKDKLVTELQQVLHQHFNYTHNADEFFCHQHTL